MKSILGNLWVRTIVGIALMFGGMYVSKAFHEVWESTVTQFGVPIDLGKTLATIGVFLVIFPLIRVFFIDPLAQAIEERNSNLERTFGEAEELRRQMQQMRSEYETRLQETEAQAREQIQASIREAQQLRQTLMAEAADKADALVLEAQQKIAMERDRIISDLRLQVVDLTLAAAEKVIGENLDDARNRRLVTDFIQNAEVAR